MTQEPIRQWVVVVYEGSSKDQTVIGPYTTEAEADAAVDGIRQLVTDRDDVIVFPIQPSYHM